MNSMLVDLYKAARVHTLRMRDGPRPLGLTRVGRWTPNTGMSTVRNSIATMKSCNPWRQGSWKTWVRTRRQR